MKKIKKYEELTIKDDFMFGIIMRNPKYCKTFLETVLDVKISRIEYPGKWDGLPITNEMFCFICVCL